MINFCCLLFPVPRFSGTPEGRTQERNMSGSQTNYLEHLVASYDPYGSYGGPILGSKLLGGIKSIYDDSLVCVRVKGGEREGFTIDSGVRQGCIVSPWLFSVYMDAVMKEVKMGMGRRGVRFMEEGREWKLPGLLYADD